jgi:hypothetical protein
VEVLQVVGAVAVATGEAMITEAVQGGSNASKGSGIVHAHRIAAVGRGVHGVGLQREGRPMSDIAARTVVANEMEDPVPATVVDFDMPFMSMVGFMVKWSLASIPAMLILAVFWGVVGFVCMVLFGTVFAGLLSV